MAFLQTRCTPCHSPFAQHQFTPCGLLILTLSKHRLKHFFIGLKFQCCKYFLPSPAQTMIARLMIRATQKLKFSSPGQNSDGRLAMSTYWQGTK
jgi:hypothetical protein